MLSQNGITANTPLGAALATGGVGNVPSVGLRLSADDLLARLSTTTSEETF
jgi:hypothetical protein